MYKVVALYEEGLLEVDVFAELRSQVRYRKLGRSQNCPHKDERNHYQSIFLIEYIGFKME